MVTGTSRPAAYRLLITLVVVPAIVLLGGSPALAHTSLAGSDPANLSRLGSSPDTLRLDFTDPVIPRTTSIKVVDLSGEEFPGAERLTPSGSQSATVEFSLPDLPEGTYGFTWQSIGPDGHRAAGEVVVGIGNVSQQQLDGARFQTLSARDRILDGAGAAGRLAWYTGLSLVAGAMFVLLWMASRTDTWSAAGRTLWTSARFWLQRGLRVALVGAGVRSAATVTVLSDTVTAESAAARFAAVMGTGGPLFELAVVVLLSLAVPDAHKLSVTPYAGRRDPRWRRLGLLIGLSVLAGSVGGHLAVNRPPEIAAVVSAAHIAAAALWIGPLALMVLWRASSPASGADPGERSRVLRNFFPGFAKAAGWSLLVLALTGAETMWANLGTSPFANAYGVTLGIKLALLLVVILPLAWMHDRRVRSDPGGLDRSLLSRSYRGEVAGLACVLVLASSLALLNPTSGTGGTTVRDPVDVLSSEPVADVSECADLTIGQANCYQAYFSDLMRREDAGTAVAKILEVSATDSYVASQCHQVTHDLGREAATYYDDLGEALSFEASACWSGYYHGVVEQTMPGLDDAELLDQIPTICSEAAREQYSFSHYNCVHGVGHGIMLRFDADLFDSIPYCEALVNPWELSSCLSGAFMQNIVSAQEGTVPATFREGDLIYPCNAVAGDYKDECFGMQTSYILWRTNHDLSQGFAACDRVEADYIDDCYQSMGRDISGGSLLDPQSVVDGCALGRADHRQFCIVGASLNAVFNDHNPDKADELCAIVDPQFTAACRAARDRAMASFR